MAEIKQAFVTACHDGSFEAVQALLTPPESPSHTVIQAGLCKAIDARQVAIVDHLLHAGADLDESARISAYWAESSSLYGCFLEHGWDINSRTYGCTALSSATDNPVLLKWLLEHGADPNIKNYREPPGVKWISPMETALADNHLQSMRILVQFGAVLELKLLEKCLGARRAPALPDEALQCVLDLGMDPNQYLDNCEGSPLQVATRRGLTEKVRLLLLAGANLDVRNDSSQTPLDEAKEAGNQAMVELLQRHDHITR